MDREEQLIEKLKDLYGKDVVVTCNDNEKVIGFFCIFTWAEDNEEGEGASITIENEPRLIEIFLSDIKDVSLYEMRK